MSNTPEYTTISITRLSKLDLELLQITLSMQVRRRLSLSETITTARELLAVAQDRAVTAEDAIEVAAEKKRSRSSRRR